MTDHLAMTPTDRRKKIRRLQEMMARKQSDGNRAVHDHCKDSSVGFALWDDSNAICWALGYVERHVNLLTGELTISLDEPEEVA